MATGKRKTLILLAAIVLLALILRVAFLEPRQFAVDEAFTFSFIQNSYAKMLELFQTVEPLPPLYPFLARAVLLVSGSIYWVRMASVLFGVASVFVSYLAAKEFFNERTALLTAAFVAFNPLCVFYSQQLRAYSLLMLLFLLLVLLLAKLSKEPKTSTLLLLGLVNALVLYTHYQGAPILLTEAVFLGILLKRKKITPVQGIAPLAIAAVLFLPWAPVLWKQLWFVKGGSYGGTSLDFAYIFYKFAAGANASFLLERQPLLLVLVPAVSLLFFYGVFLLAREKKQDFLCILALPLAFSVALAFFVPLMLHFRHLSYLIPLYLMASAFAVSKTKSRALVFLAAAVILLWACIIAMYYGIVSVQDWNIFMGL
ncbi:MAG: glycosyltransferase family 39 protein [Candidatus Diapherotrites archaeon]|nr:glycosyltransferase family 39 protein [Candidatus Diapherotrites archaeon]